jgi:hypothetical protein
VPAAALRIAVRHSIGKAAETVVAFPPFAGLETQITLRVQEFRQCGKNTSTDFTDCGDFLKSNGTADKRG